ncbi:MAG TPA: hypothetical protein VEC02_06640 [Nitrososphaerales archaeon]|nr:hypothetical protein [Nitrososphaerales archaeon]
MICERCHAGQMVRYSRTIPGEKPTAITGTRCDRCGFVLLDDDESIWSAVGL